MLSCTKVYLVFVINVRASGTHKESDMFNKFVSALVVTVAMFVSIPAAQAQCLLCGVIGFALGSSSGDNASPMRAGGGGSVLYVAPRIAERISNPLEVHIASTNYLRFYKISDRVPEYTMGHTVQQVFDKTVPNSGKYVILEVMRVISPENASVAVFWFAYIEKEKMHSLESLVQPKR